MPFQPIPGVLVLGLGHKARHGKDTVAQAMMASNPTNSTRIGFADALYDYCRVEHGMTTKDPALLQRIGIEMRARDPLTWINAVYWKIHDIAARWDRVTPQVVIIPDTRFTNEAEFIREMGGYLIKVERRHTSLDPTLRDTRWVSADRDPHHISETQLDGHLFDLTITNRSLDTTRQCAVDALNFFKEKYALEATHG